MTSSNDLPKATFRTSNDDFRVDEIPAYSPNGKGEHVFVTFRKTGLTTESAVRAIARALDADPRNAGYAGMKDRNAVTTQTASFQLPISRDPTPLLAAATIPGVEILSVARHENKLKPGHLVGNRFRIVLRDIDDEASAAILRERLLTIGRVGVPNAFGPQRFGRDGDNPERFLAWVRSGAPHRGRGAPRDKREQRLLFSAFQSMLFNRVLDAREADGSWAHVLPGDLAKKHDTGGLFLVPPDEADPEVIDAKERALAGGISATGPMFGAKMRWPEGAPRALELQILKAVMDNPAEIGAGSAGVEGRAPIASIEDAANALEPLRHLGEGTRRSLRLQVSDLEVEPLDTQSKSSRALAVCFVLPKGGYATTVLARACQLVEPKGAPRGDDPGTNPARASNNDGKDDGASAPLEDESEE